MNVFDIEELRRRGLQDEALYPDIDIIEGEQRVWDFIEAFCNQFFEPRELTLYVDGNGESEILLPCAIVDVTEVSIAGVPYDLNQMVVYNRVYPDDRRAPKIGFRTGGVFPEGIQNVEVKGTFGFVEKDTLLPPPALMEAAKKLLVMIALNKLTDDAFDAPVSSARLIQENTDKYFYKLAAQPPINGATGVPEIDRVLFLYRRGGDDQVWGKSV